MVFVVYGLGQGQRLGHGQLPYWMSDHKVYCYTHIYGVYEIIRWYTNNGVLTWYISPKKKMTISKSGTYTI